MKIEHIRYILEIYKTGSISQAAKNLYVSQPNVSSALKNLEQELGFTIVNRTNTGIAFTKEGIELVRHGRSILEHIEQIEGIPTRDAEYRFSMASSWFTPAEYAFSHLVGEYSLCEKVRFRFYNRSQADAMAMMADNSIDLAVFPSNSIGTPFFREEIEMQGLVYVDIGAFTCNVNLSASHPLINETPFPFDKLWDYPHIKYIDESPTDPTYTLEFVNPKKIIEVDSREARSYLVNNTLGYGIGLPMPKKRTAQLGVTSIPLPNRTLHFGYVYSKERSLTGPAARYLELLLEETSYLVQDSD